MSRITRAERHAQILAARSEGLTDKHIALRLGISYSLVREILSDPDGSRARERKRGYAGTCAQCGGPTDGSNGRDKAPSLCRYCVRGLPRPKPPDNRRRVPVRLPEIPLERRLAAAEQACRIEKGDFERQEILFAAISPSNTVYWVAA